LEGLEGDYGKLSAKLTVANAEPETPVMQIIDDRSDGQERKLRVIAKGQDGDDADRAVMHTLTSDGEPGALGVFCDLNHARSI
jgi:hypothetical protein